MISVLLHFSEVLSDLNQMLAGKELEFVSLCSQIYIKETNQKINIFLTESERREKRTITEPVWKNRKNREVK